MKQGKVMNNSIVAGIITQLDNGTYKFEYNEFYFKDTAMPAISLTLPKTQQLFTSPILFPFFFSLLSEGANKKLQSRILKIDETDYFEFLLKTANHETIGAVKVEKLINE